VAAGRAAALGDGARSDPVTTIAVSPGTFGPLIAREPEIAPDLLPVLCGMLRDADQHE